MSDGDVFEAVQAELASARTRYPWWPNRSIVHAAAIASEESGEVVKAANNWYWRQGDDTTEDIRKEAVQAIAMWVRFLTEGDYTREDA
jgi:NTP pyrophosphatase (non-canonical NTP hydrolase)